MLIDMSHAVGAYLTDVFVTRLDWWVLLGLIAQGLFTMRFLVQWIASERAGHSVIPLAFWIVLDLRRRAAAGLCALPQGRGVHRRPGVRRIRLSAQSLFRAARPQGDDRGLIFRPHESGGGGPSVAREASGGWWKGRGPRRFSCDGNEAPSQTPPPPPFGWSPSPAIAGADNAIPFSRRAYAPELCQAIPKQALPSTSLKRREAERR